MAFVWAAGALGAGISAFWYWYRSGSPSQLSDVELQKTVLQHRNILHNLLSTEFLTSTTRGRAVSLEYAKLLVSVGFADAISALKLCVTSDLVACDLPSMFFRTNSFHTRLVMDLLREYGQVYTGHLQDPVLAFYQNWTIEEARSYELSPPHVSSEVLNGRSMEEYLQEAQPKFQQVCETLLDTLCAMPVPLYISYMIKMIQQHADEKYGPGAYDAAGGILILRLAIPALVVAQGSAKPPHQRVIIRAAQVIQSISNEVLPYRGETSMQFLTPWIQEKMPLLKAWKAETLRNAPTTLEEASSSIPTNFISPPQCPEIAAFLSEHPLNIPSTSSP